MSKAIVSSHSKPTLPDLDRIARETQLVIRASPKFTPCGFLQSLLSAVATGLGSLNQIVGDLKARVQAGMSRQSLHEHFDARSTAFLLSVASDLMEQRLAPAAAVLQGSGILRLILEDASAQVMPKANSGAFAAHGNHHGDTAGVKIDLVYDLLSCAMITHTLQAATEQDKTIGKDLLPELRQGDLVLRDMGYFVLSEFTAIEDGGAWWLTRLPLTTGVVLKNGDALERRLKGCRHDILDLAAFAGDQRKECRVVAVRAAPEVAEARRAERRAKARKSGKKACPKGLIRDGWHIMLTNLGKEQASVAQLAAIYRARWAVEIQFRAWKQSLNLGKALNRKSGEHHMQALVLAGMIAHQLGMRIARRIGDEVGRASLSYEKLYDLLATHMVKSRGLAEVFAFDPDPRHVKRDKRARKSPVEEGILALA